MRVNLLGGAYTTQSVIADAQRCVNLYPEKNPEDAEAPVAHYCTPGLRLLAQADDQGCRALFTAPTGDLYGVYGSSVYYIDPNWVFTKIGAIPPGTSPVKMKDNAILIVIAQGLQGFTINLATRAFSILNDANYLGSNFVSYLDTFFIFTQPGTRQFFSSLSNSITFDPLYVAGKSGGTDLLQIAYVNHREIYLIGQRTSEVWYDAGNSGFPFAAVNGVFIEHGTPAPFSVASHDLSVVFLAQSAQGDSYFVMVGPTTGYKAARISTFSIEQEISQYADLTDAVAFIYKQQGHIFYVVNFPSADHTWVYDMTESLWHQRDWIDSNGVSHRDRPQCHAFAYGMNVVGDWANGNLYLLDPYTYTSNGAPIRRLRTLPHVLDKDDGKKLVYTRFTADVETGTVPNGASPGIITLRWSTDRGKSWMNPVQQSLGGTGQYHVQPTWRRLGIGRSMTFELSHSIPGPVALTGAWIDAMPSVT